MLLQTVAEESNPNWSHTRENAERLRAAGLEVVELPLLPYVDHDGPPTVVPYTNFYICNGAADRPGDGPGDRRGGARAARAASTRVARSCRSTGTTLALGGGGVHCITQQVPAVA